MSLLDGDVYTAEQVQENYRYLVEKWGEWEIIGEGKAGLVVRYVDVRNAMFSGLMIMFLTLTMITLCLAIVFGKIVFPLLSKKYKEHNEEMVDVATLKSATQINELTKASKKEWF